MGIEFKDYGNFVVNSCQLIRDGVKSIEPILKKDSSLSRRDIATIDRMFVRLTLLMRGLKEIVYPTPSTGEVHGLPREATDSPFKPSPVITHTEKTSWDFQPWLTEKLLLMSVAIDLLIREAEKKFHPDEPLPGEIAGSANLLFHSGCICRLAQVVIEMFESGQLKFKDIRIEDEEI